MLAGGEGERVSGGESSTILRSRRTRRLVVSAFCTGVICIKGVWEEEEEEESTASTASTTLTALMGATGVMGVTGAMAAKEGGGRTV